MADRDADLLRRLDNTPDLDLHTCQCGRPYSDHNFRKADPCGALRLAAQVRNDAWWERELGAAGVILGIAVLFVVGTYALAQLGAPFSVWLWSLL